jgi:hypothetical protein
MWNFWWMKWHWDRFFSEFFGFPLSMSFQRRSPNSYHLGDEQYVPQWQQFRDVVSPHRNQSRGLMAPARFETGTFILAAKPIWARRLTSLSKFMKGNIFHMKKQLSDPHHVLDAQCKLLPCGTFKQM